MAFNHQHPVQKEESKRPRAERDDDLDLDDEQEETLAAMEDEFLRRVAYFLRDGEIKEH